MAPPSTKGVFVRSIEVSQLPERAVIEAGMKVFHYVEERLGFQDAVVHQENRITALFPNPRDRAKRTRYENGWKKGEQLLERFAA